MEEESFELSACRAKIAEASFRQYRFDTNVTLLDVGNWKADQALDAVRSLKLECDGLVVDASFHVIFKSPKLSDVSDVYSFRTAYGDGGESGIFPLRIDDFNSRKWSLVEELSSGSIISCAQRDIDVHLPNSTN